MKLRKKSSYGLKKPRQRHYSPFVELLEPRIVMHGAGIEVEAQGIYRPLDGTIVSTISPTVRITIPEEHLGKRVRVWLDDLDRETPREDITGLFPTLDVTGIESAKLDLGLGAHSIEVRAGNHLAEATMLNIRDEMSVVSSPLFRDYEFDSTLDARYEKRSLLLNFLDNTPLEAISNYLGREELTPLDIVVPMKIVRVETPEGFDPVSLADVLMSRNDVYLEGAVPNFAMSFNEIEVKGEAVPMRLTKTYNADSGGFYTAQGTRGEDFAEIKALRPHFYMDTFAGHRLVSALVGTNSAPVAVAVIDTGFGDGTNHTDIPETAIISPTDGRLLNANATGQPETAVVVEVSNIADQQPEGGHGTAVAAAVAGRGKLNLGTGPHVNVRPMRSRGNVVGGKFSPDMGSVVAALQAAALDANVAVVNTSLGSTTDGTANIFADVTNQLRTNNKVWVIAWGNEGTDQNPPLPASLAPGPSNRSATDPLILTVSSTGTMNPISGPETLTLKSNFGPRTSVSAPGENIFLPRDNGTLREFSGTSLAAPLVAGLAGEMIYADRNYISDAASRFTPLQIIELIEATADDLGSTITGPNSVKPNNAPKNGHDPLFGHGRINVWKAMLAVANRGISFVTGEFPSLITIGEAATTWYGFKIRTNQPGATVWLDDKQLKDTGATMPGDPEKITSYAGVQPHTEKFEVSKNDTRHLLDRGVVPIGTERGEYVATFSIRKADLMGRRTLNLRMGDDPSVPAYFTLPLDLSDMRVGRVAGVTFDDFVFEITPTDFGDAPDTPEPTPDASDKPGYPTILRHERGIIVENGARHLNSNFEWLGRGSNRESVSPEVNANTHTDIDGRPNMVREDKTVVHDLDRLDDGVRFFPLTYQTGSDKGIMELTVSVADHKMGSIPLGTLARYENHADKLLYINAWMDWNGNGIFEEINNEHVINGLRLNPSANFGVIDTTSTTRIDLTSDKNTAALRSTFKVGTIGKGTIHARVRLDYGENAGKNTALKMFVGDKTLDLASGPAQYGEVEDYQISVDYGDAKDPFNALAGQYPTKYTPGAKPTDRPIVDGARHLDTTKEWLGATVTREFAAHGAAAGDADDGKPNLGVDGKSEDLDRGDDTTVEYSELSRSLRVSYMVTSSIASHGFTNADTPAVSRGKGRYDATDAKQSIFVNIWSDWDGNGSWDDPGEHVLVNSAIDPTTFGPDGKYTLGEKFVDNNRNGVYEPDFDSFTDFAGINSRSFVSRFSPPSGKSVAGKFYVRTRLTYGETVTGPTTLAGAYSVEPIRYLSGPRGAALFGEVEDVAVFTGSIRGLKWQDFFENGVREFPLEPGLNGWTITLFVKSGPTLTPIATQITGPFDANHNGSVEPGMEWGYYAFEGLPPGSYVVAEGILPTWTQMFPTATTPGSEALPADKLDKHSPFGHLVVLGPGATVVSKDFGNAPPRSGSVPGQSTAQATNSGTTGSSVNTENVATTQTYSSITYEEFETFNKSALISEFASGDPQQWSRALTSMFPVRRKRADKVADKDFEQLVDLLAVDLR